MFLIRTPVPNEDASARKKTVEYHKEVQIGARKTVSVKYLTTTAKQYKKPSYPCRRNPNPISCFNPVVSPDEHLKKWAGKVPSPQEEKDGGCIQVRPFSRKLKGIGEGEWYPSTYKQQLTTVVKDANNSVGEPHALPPYPGHTLRINDVKLRTDQNEKNSFASKFENCPNTKELLNYKRAQETQKKNESRSIKHANKSTSPSSKKISKILYVSELYQYTL